MLFILALKKIHSTIDKHCSMAEGLITKIGEMDEQVAKDLRGMLRFYQIFYDCQIDMQSLKNLKLVKLVIGL